MIYLTISKAARNAGVGVETIRFYERKGLIKQPPKPLDGGYRIYPVETVAHIRFIRQAQEIGFSLREIEELLSLRADPSADCSDVRERAAAKLEEVDRKMERLGRIRAALDRSSSISRNEKPMAMVTWRPLKYSAAWLSATAGVTAGPIARPSAIAVPRVIFFNMVSP